MQAEKYLTLAADYGNPHAAYQLAKLYIRQETDRLRREPEEIPDHEKIKKAAAWLRKAAEQGNPSADYALGKLYGDGILTARDMDRAFFHLQRAAAAGNVYAQYRLGRWYLDEEYKNIPQAVHYLTMAADQNHDLAAYHLGKLYLAGEGIPKNAELAIGYLEQSARAGNQYAQYTLGKVYLIGKDAGKDKEKAYAYFKLAAEQGNLYAAYFLEHWNDLPHPDLFLMASRLMHHLGNIMEEDVTGRKRGGSRMCNAALYSRRKKHFIFDSINTITAPSFR